MKIKIKNSRDIYRPIERGDLTLKLVVYSDKFHILQKKYLVIKNDAQSKKIKPYESLWITFKNAINIKQSKYYLLFKIDRVAFQGSNRKYHGQDNDTAFRNLKKQIFNYSDKHLTKIREEINTLENDLKAYKKEKLLLEK